MPVRINHLGWTKDSSALPQSFLGSNLAASQKFVFFGLFYVVLSLAIWIALHFLIPQSVPNFAFGTMVLAGLSFLLLPKIGYLQQGVQIGLWGTWLSVLLLAQNAFFGPVFAVSGFIIVTLMVMIFARGRMWIWMTLLSLCAIVLLNFIQFSKSGTPENEAMAVGLMLAQLAQFLGAAVLFSLIFAKFKQMLDDTVESNTQLSEQRLQLQEHSAELEQLNSQLNNEIIRKTEAQTAHEQATQALKSKTDLLEIVTQNLPARIVYIDANETIQFFNPAFAKHFDVSHLSPPLPLQTAVSEKTLHAIAEPIDLIMRTGETVIKEFHELDREGRSRVSRKVFVPHIVNDKVIGRVILGIDVTELRSTQASLEQADRILQSVNDNLPARITYMDVNGYVLYSNRYPEQVGHRQSSLLGCSKHTRLLGASSSALVHHEKRAFAGMSGDFEVRRLLPDGSEIVEMVRYVPQKEDGALIGVFALCTDVTESRSLEEMFQQSQKLESLGMLAGGVAHDFNNLLAGVLGQSSVALARLTEEHPARRHVERAMTAAEKASILTKQMLAYSGKGAFSVALLDINKLIQQNLELLDVT